MKVQLKTVFFLGLLTGILFLVGFLIGGIGGLTIAFILALLMNFFAYWFSDKIVLKMYRAKEVSEEQNPQLHKIVDEVRERFGVPKPKIYLVNNASPNAFATGRNPEHAAIAVTTGILQLLNEEELKGVIAHEFSHIKNRDILISSVVAVIAGTIGYIAFMARWAAIFGGYGGRDRNGGNLISLLVLAILIPIIATIVRLAISRSREYFADETAARTMNYSKGLASALRKLEAGVKQVPMRKANQGTEHMFIMNPFAGRRFFEFFSTHPPVQKRVAKLNSLGI